MQPGIDYIGITTPFYCTDGNGRILLQKRSKKARDEQGVWDPGGGSLEFGEQPEECVLREIKEEYGCDGTILHKLPAFSLLRNHNEKMSHWLVIPFVVQVVPEEVKNNNPEKIDEIAWFQDDNLPTPLHPAFSKEVVDRYIKKS